MSIHELAGLPAPRERLANIPRLMSQFYTDRPDPDDPSQQVAFGTSGHRGSSVSQSFNEDHILAISQAIAEHRQHQGITGPLFVAKDTHALSEAAFVTALEVLAANEVEIVIDSGSEFTPTPVLSHAVLTHNRGRETALADGIVITPSHNPPEDGGYKYNPPTGGPADTHTTRAVQDRANELLVGGLNGVKRIDARKARLAPTTRQRDLLEAYVVDLDAVIDFEVIRHEGLRLGVDPLGGASVDYWDRITERYGIAIEVVNRVVDPSFSFMRLDWDGKIRMDCSSPHAMAGLINLKDRFDVAFGNDPDADRHGIVTPSAGLMNPNHYLSVMVWYLMQHREGWSKSAGVGKTLVSSSMLDRVAAHLGRRLVEVPVGFKWFVDGLLDGSIAFAGEESAGASFLRKDGQPWTTDKDGLVPCLLAAELTSCLGRDPSEVYRGLEEAFGRSVYARTDAAATRAQKAVLQKLSAEAVQADTLAGERIVAKQTSAPGNGAPIGGLKVVTENGWFAARPSGTEDVYKIYAESFRGEDHLRRIQEEAQSIVSAALGASGA